MNNVPDFTFELKGNDVKLGFSPNIFVNSDGKHVSEITDCLEKRENLPEHIIKGLKNDVKNMRNRVKQIVFSKMRPRETYEKTFMRLHLSQDQELLSLTVPLVILLNYMKDFMGIEL
jgi:hypothetical protein